MIIDPLRRTNAVLPERFKRLGEPYPSSVRFNSCVYKLVQPITHVMKVIDCGQSASRLAATQYEVRVMKRLRGCPYAIQIVDHQLIQQSGDVLMCIVETYCPPLADRRVLGLTVGECLDIGRGVLDALIAFREAGVYHLDVQPSNVFVCEDGQVKLGDFGSSLFIEDVGKDDGCLRGTVAFMAPEVYRSCDYSEQSEIYAVGMLLYYLLNNLTYPWSGTQAAEGAPWYLLAGTPLPTLEHMDATAARLIMDGFIRPACAFDPASRPSSFEEVRERLMALGCELIKAGIDLDRPIGMHFRDSPEVPFYPHQDLANEFADTATAQRRWPIPDGRDAAWGDPHDTVCHG